MKHNHYFMFEPINTATIEGSYNLSVVLLSYIVASLAGMCAFSILKCIYQNKSNKTLLTLIGGIVLGLGMWGMHFTGMVAFTLPITVLYDPEITLISTFPAILSSIVFLDSLSKKHMSKLKVILIALVLAIGIASMHFIGMAAMSMKAYMAHELISLFLAVLSSWLLAIATVYFYQRKVPILVLSKRKHQMFCSLIFGFSCASMHYLAMSSTYFFEDKTVQVSGISNEILIQSLILFSVLLMGGLLLVLAFQHKIDKLKSNAKIQRIRESETINNMQDGFVLSDKEGNILLLNKKFKDTFGLQIEVSSIPEKNINQLISRLMTNTFTFDGDADKQRALDKLKKCGEASESFRLQDKASNWWLFRQNKTTSGGMIQTWTDISSQVLQENELQQANNVANLALEHLKETQEELLETKKMASLGGLITGVAHELNTPLGICITSLSSIKDITDEIQLRADNNSIKKSTLDSSVKSILKFEYLASLNLERMAKLVEQFKYISVDQDIEKIKAFLLKNTLSDIYKLRRNHLIKNKIKFSIDVSRSIKLCSYENALIQVLVCLIDNTIKHAFTKTDSAVIAIRAFVQENEVVILYQDNGCGINDDIKDKVFDPFITTNRSSGGTGLGLHIAYNLVTQKLKGKIKLKERSKEYNTVFSVCIPIILQDTKLDT